MGRERGFTLIELLAVTAILAVLAGLLFPVLARAQAAGKATVCVSQLRQLSVALHLYASDHDDRIVLETPRYVANDLRPPRSTWGEPFDSQLRSAPLWPSVHLRYGMTREQHRCPLDPGPAVPPNLPEPSAFLTYGSSYLYDFMGALRLGTFGAVPNPATRVLAMDYFGSHHEITSPQRFAVRTGCVAYDGHAYQSDQCRSRMTESPAFSEAP